MERIIDQFLRHGLACGPECFNPGLTGKRLLVWQFQGGIVIQGNVDLPVNAPGRLLRVFLRGDASCDHTVISIHFDAQGRAGKHIRAARLADANLEG